MMLSDDAALVQAAQAGPQGFAVLYERHYPAVFAFAYSRVADRARAEDVAAQTFLQALQAIGRYEHRGVPILRWLMRIAANVIVEMHRRCPPATQSLAEHDYALPDPEHRLERWEIAQDMALLLEALTDDQREVVTLRFACDLKVAQIAASTGRSEGAVKMLLSRGLTVLRRQLEPQAQTGGAVVRRAA